jgi:hypothetical protein
MVIQSSSRRSNSVQLMLESWAFRSSNLSAPEVDSMVLSRDPEDCDTNVLRQQQSFFMRLPVELLLLIASFLEPNDAACLTLSCKRATCAIGLSSWKHIGRGRECRLERISISRVRWKFLQALERDLPNYHLCHFCEIFLKETHVNHSHFSSNYKRSLDICRRKKLSNIPVTDSGYNNARIANELSFCDVQSILRAAALDDTSVNSLEYLHISTPWQRTASSSHRHITYLMKSDERPLIHNNELCMYICSRRWALCSADEIKTQSPHCLFFQDLAICRHQLLAIHDKAIQKTIQDSTLDPSIIFASVSKSKGLVSVPFGCPRCPIECRYTIFNHGLNGIELALEIGHVFGAAISLQDMEWAGRGPPECQPYSFDEPKVFPYTPFDDRSRFTRSGGDPSLMYSHHLHRRIEEINGPTILKEPGKVLQLLSPEGAVSAFDPEVVKLARAQRTPMWAYARHQSDKDQVMRKGQDSRWQKLSARWTQKQRPPQGPIIEPGKGFRIRPLDEHGI